MAETAKYPMENEIGCGFMSSVFHLKVLRQRNSPKPQPVQHKKPPEKPIPPRIRSSNRFSDAARKSTSSSNNSSSNKSPQLANTANNTKQLITNEPSFTSTELSLTLADHHKKLDSIGTLYRASTGNVMLLGHLGNVKQQHGKGLKSKENIIARKHQVETGHQLLGNIVRSPRNNRLNPDVIKSLGNDKYKEGKYEEALALYNQAISMDPGKACYYSNKSAALIGLGRFVEAVAQCREAVRLDSSYHNAHYRLAKLYLRLGVAEKAVYHYKCSGRKAGPEDVGEAQDLKNCLERCIEAQNHGEWIKLLNESNNAILLGADSAPQIYAMKAEALMGLRRHDEAYNVIQNAPHFSIELYAGSSATAGVLQVRSLVYMANGRFEEAVTCIQQALQLDSSNYSMKLTAERVRYVASARLNGNRLFKGSRFSEALTSYNEGLERDPHNSVLLCNRAACRYKLGKYEKAIEDCTAALLLRPSYAKARLRRANSNAQLEKWGAAIQDYEVLMQEIPGDEGVRTALSEAKMQLNKMQNGYRNGSSQV